MSHRAFEMLCEYALTRDAFGAPLADKQTVQNWIADSAAEIHAARLMVLHAAWMIELVGDRAARKYRTRCRRLPFFLVLAFYKVLVITEDVRRRFLAGTAAGPGIEQMGAHAHELGDALLQFATASSVAGLNGRRTSPS